MSTCPNGPLGVALRRPCINVRHASSRTGSQADVARWTVGERSVGHGLRIDHDDAEPRSFGPRLLVCRCQRTTYTRGHRGVRLLN